MRADCSVLTTELSSGLPRAAVFTPLRQRIGPSERLAAPLADVFSPVRVDPVEQRVQGVDVDSIPMEVVTTCAVVDDPVRLLR
jgi:hypothetical protein